MSYSEKFLINPTNEFHILRHFKYVDDSYKNTLIGKSYWYYDFVQKEFILSKISNIDIENALETIGTKFEKNIIGIENPKQILKIIKNKFKDLESRKQINWSENIDYKITMFRFDYESLVGQMNCLDKNYIPEQYKSQIKPVFRSKCEGEDTIIVNTVSGIKLSSTKSIQVEIVETKKLPFYTITAFPDCLLSDDIIFENIVFVI